MLTRNKQSKAAELAKAVNLAWMLTMFTGLKGYKIKNIYKIKPISHLGLQNLIKQVATSIRYWVVLRCRHDRRSWISICFFYLQKQPLGAVLHYTKKTNEKYLKRVQSLLKLQAVGTISLTFCRTAILKRTYFCRTPSLTASIFKYFHVVGVPKFSETSQLLDVQH